MAIDAIINAHMLECIRRRRIEKGLRVQDMARRTGIPIGSYSCLETGRYRMSLENLFRILAVLGADIREVWPGPKQGQVKQVTDGYIRQVVEKARQQQPELVSYQDIFNAVCKAYGLTEEQLSSPSRRRDLSEARTVATILVKEQRHLSLVGLSQLLKRDVSSLSHCLRRLNERLVYDKGLRARIRQVRKAVAEAQRGSNR